MKIPDDVRTLAVQVGADVSAVSHKLDFLAMELTHVAEGDAGDFNLNMLRDLILGCANDLARTAFRVADAIDGDAALDVPVADSFAPWPTAHVLGETPEDATAERGDDSCGAYARSVGRQIGVRRFQRDRAGMGDKTPALHQEDFDAAARSGFTPESPHWRALIEGLHAAYAELSCDALYPVPPVES